MSPSLSARVLRLPLRWSLGAAAVLALSVSAAFHGLSPVAASQPSSTPVGTRIAGGPWDVTVESARLLSSQDGLTTINKGDRWLAVIATIDVTTTDSRDDLSIIFQLPHVPGLLTQAPERILLARDATDLGYLNPGMPESVAFLWEQPSSAPVPTSVDVAVYGEEFQTNSLTGSMDWQNRALRTTVHAPVQDKRT